MELVAGGVGHIAVQVDWHNLGSVPVEINVKDVFACIRLRPLDSSESSSESDPEPEQKPSSTPRELPDFIQNKLDNLKENVRKIVENIQFTLINVHIRFEDDVTAQLTGGRTDKRSCTAMGVMIDRLAISNAVLQENGEWWDGFVNQPVQVTTKRIVLGKDRGVDGSGLSVYCCCETTGQWNEGGARPMPSKLARKNYRRTFMKTMREMIGSDDLSYIIYPIQTELLLRVENTDCAPWREKDTRLKNGVRIVKSRSNKKGSFATQVRKQPFLDGLYRYEPLHAVKVSAGEVKLVLDSTTLRYFVSLAKYTADVLYIPTNSEESGSDLDTSSSDEETTSSGSSDDDSSSSSSSSSSGSEEDGAKDSGFPDEWIKMRMEFELSKASLTLTRKSGTVEIRRGELQNLNCTVEIRQAGGISARTKLSDLTLTDICTDTVVLQPDDRSLTNVGASHTPLLDLCVEIGYIGGQRCDLTKLSHPQDWNLRLKAMLQPVNVLLDVYSLNDLSAWAADITDDRTVVDERATALAAKARQRVQDRYTAAVAMQRKKLYLQAVATAKSGADKVHLDIDLSPPVLIIPSRSGRDDKDRVVVALGHIVVDTHSIGRAESRSTRRGKEDNNRHEIISLALRGLNIQHRGKYVIKPVDLEAELWFQSLLHTGKMTTLWSHIDADGNGELSKDELFELLALLKVAADQVDEIFYTIDRDNDRHISKPEFIQWWRETQTHQMHSGIDATPNQVAVHLDELAIKPTDDLMLAIRRVVRLWFPAKQHVSLRSAELPDGLGYIDGIITEQSSGHHNGTARRLKGLGITSLAVRRKSSWRGQYEICFETQCCGTYFFTDATGERFEVLCDEAPEAYTKSFSSDQPRLVLVETGDISGVATRAMTAAKGFLGDKAIDILVSLIAKLGGLDIKPMKKTVSADKLILALIQSISLVAPFVKLLGAADIVDRALSNSSADTWMDSKMKVVNEMVTEVFDLATVKSLTLAKAEAPPLKQVGPKRSSPGRRNP